MTRPALAPGDTVDACKEIAMGELGMLLLGALVGWLARVWADRVQRRELFDHKLRLEKEYQIYADLWEKLFEFRRCAHGFVDPLQQGARADPWEPFVESFNAFQGVVSRNEPFIAPKVWEPARAIVSQGHVIAGAAQHHDELGQRRASIQDYEADERLADKMIDEHQKQQAAIEEVERLFPLVKDAIRHRITLTTGSD